MGNKPEFGKLIIITAPSGSGKTSIVTHLLEKYKDLLSFSISATTRMPRKGEHEGKDYYFLSREDFETRIREKKFLEWQMVYEGQYYGTLKTEIERLWSEGKVPILDIDVKGAVYVINHYPVDTLSIFVQAPSVEELEKRLKKRGSETDDSLKTRLDKAKYEMTFKNHFQFTVVNDKLEDAFREADKIIGDFLKND